MFRHIKLRDDGLQMRPYTFDRGGVSLPYLAGSYSGVFDVPCLMLHHAFGLIEIDKFLTHISESYCAVVRKALTDRLNQFSGAWCNVLGVCIGAMICGTILKEALKLLE